MAYSTELKKQYLKYNASMKRRYKTPLTWAQWLKKKGEIKKTGLSSQSRKQLAGLSKGDYSEVMSVLEGKKRKK